MHTRVTEIVTVLLASALTTAACAAAEPGHNTLTKQEAADGWILLFDGATTFGWENHGDGKWKVVDGTLVCEEGTRGWFGTTTEFADFILKCQYRISAKGNSGVFFRTKRQTDRPWVDGYEMQICDHHERDATGSIVRRIRAKYPADKGVTTVEKWQDVEIRAEGDHIQVTLNGVKVVDGQDDKFGRGHVGVQLHDPGMKIEFRDIKLRPLGAKSIFNGKDLTGWEILPGLRSKFSVQPEGVLNVRSGHGQIATVGQWADFVLQLEIKTGGRHENSGVFFRAEPGKKWQGYESQIYNRWRDGDRTQPADYGTGGIYNRQPGRKVYSNDREWFTMTVVAHGRHLATWVNGNQAADWTDTRPPNRNARRGYRAEPGAILLQGHDRKASLSFRNLRVVEYPKGAAN